MIILATCLCIILLETTEVLKYIVVSTHYMQVHFIYHDVIE